MITLKTLKPEAVPAAIQKAKQYRLLNEPNDAESICLDILATDPGHQEALKILVLALSDKFSDHGLIPSFQQAQKYMNMLGDSHCKRYYEGIIFERRAKFHLKQGGPGSGSVAYDFLVKAMDAFSAVLEQCDEHNQKAVLRWNSCARIINDQPGVKAMDSDSREMLLDAFEIPH